jgi:GntR family transcriptional repressor for pyruvate dehydrogenase complex
MSAKPADDRSQWLPSERALAEDLGVSRPVIREATRQLELQGVLEVRHGIGVRFVNQLHRPVGTSVALLVPDKAERLRQLTEARLAVEPEVAALAAERAGAADIVALEVAQDALASAEPRDAIEHDLAFHAALAAAGGNRVLKLLLDSLADLGHESRRVTLKRYGAAPAVSQHALILDAVRRHDAPAARVAMMDHLHATMRDLRATASPVSPKSTRTSTGGEIE